MRLTAPDLLSAPPHQVMVDGGRPRAVQGWAGPWPLHQRWWAPGSAEGIMLAVARRFAVAYMPYQVGRLPSWVRTAIALMGLVSMTARARSGTN